MRDIAEKGLNQFHDWFYQLRCIGVGNVLTSMGQNMYKHVSAMKCSPRLILIPVKEINMC